MVRREIIFRILGLVVTVGLGIASIVVESKRKIRLTAEDKEDIAEQVAKKIKPVKTVKPKVDPTAS